MEKVTFKLKKPLTIQEVSFPKELTLDDIAAIFSYFGCQVEIKLEGKEIQEKDSGSAQKALPEEFTNPYVNLCA